MENDTAQGGRSEVIAPHGMVATSQPLAVEVGLDILKRGGTPSMRRSPSTRCSVSSSR
jgi:gamma-glutamyltranspeptidase